MSLQRDREERRLGPMSERELAENYRDVVANGLLGDEQPPRDLSVRPALPPVGPGPRARVRTGSGPSRVACLDRGGHGTTPAPTPRRRRPPHRRPCGRRRRSRCSETPWPRTRRRRPRPPRRAATLGRVPSTGGSGSRPRRRRSLRRSPHRRRPGSWLSTTETRGRTFLVSASASSALLASPTTRMPSSPWSSDRRPSRTSPWSSTIKTSMSKAPPRWPGAAYWTLRTLDLMESQQVHLRAASVPVPRSCHATRRGEMTRRAKRHLRPRHDEQLRERHDPRSVDR